MIDLKILLSDYAFVQGSLEKRGVNRITLEALHDMYSHKLALKNEIELLNKTSNRLSQEVKHSRDKGIYRKCKEIKQQKQDLNKEFQTLDQQLSELCETIPNIPLITENENLAKYQIQSHFSPSSNSESLNNRPHWEIGEKLDVLDSVGATKIAGAGFALLKGQGAQLARSLMNFCLDAHKSKYTEIAAPEIVSTESMVNTGHLPKFADGAYQITNEDKWLVPSIEISLLNIHKNDVLDFSDKSLKYMAYSRCFRSKVGSAGSNTRGMQRLHEYQQVELFKFTSDEHAETEYFSLLDDSTTCLRLLSIPYRIVKVGTSSLPFAARRSFKIEAYCEANDCWLDVSTVSDFGTFQSRRGKVRYKTEKQNRYAVTMNSSGLAISRVLAILLEQNYQNDGTILIPRVLERYMK